MAFSHLDPGGEEYQARCRGYGSRFDGAEPERPKYCPDCNGVGEQPGTGFLCQRCDGTGSLP